MKLGNRIGMRVTRTIIGGVVEGVIGAACHAISGAVKQFERWRVDAWLDEKSGHLMCFVKDRWNEMPDQRMYISSESEYQEVMKSLEDERDGIVLLRKSIGLFGGSLAEKIPVGELIVPTKYVRRLLAGKLRDAYGLRQAKEDELKKAAPTDKPESGMSYAQKAEVILNGTGALRNGDREQLEQVIRERQRVKDIIDEMYVKLMMRAAEKKPA